MKITVSVNIGGVPYKISSDKSEEYVRRVAERYSEALDAARPMSRNNAMNAAILAGLAVTDELFSQRGDGESLRGQLKSYSDENSSLRAKLMKLENENAALEKRVEEAERAALEAIDSMGKEEPPVA